MLLKAGGILSSFQGVRATGLANDATPATTYLTHSGGAFRGARREPVTGETR